MWIKQFGDKVHTQDEGNGIIVAIDSKSKDQGFLILFSEFYGEENSKTIMLWPFDKDIKKGWKK